MIIAALMLPFALMQADAAPLTGNGMARFDRCVALIETDAARAYEEGMAWASETREVGGFRCAAMALIEQNRPAEAAVRFEALATVISPEATGLRAELMSQAGNAWLLGREPSRARSAFTQAIAIMEADPVQLPDLLIDRARAYAMEDDYRHAEEDLSRALDIRADDALALRLRSDARMRQSSFDLAEQDALAAVRIDPQSVEAYLALGNAREAKRTGQPIEPQ